MKTSKTTAYKKVDDFRDAINEGRLKVEAKDLSCVVYLFETPEGKPAAIGYRGRSRKPNFYYRYRSVEGRNEHIKRFFEDSVKRKVERKPDARTLKVGDILRSSWGYDQTNIDYYKVIELVGKASVKIVEIGQDRSYSAQDIGKCVPDPENVIGEPMTKRANGNSVKIYSFAWAYKVEPTVIAGAKVYSADNWTAYH